MRRILALIPLAAVLLSGCAAASKDASTDVAYDAEFKSTEAATGIYNITGSVSTEGYDPAQTPAVASEDSVAQFVGDTYATSQDIKPNNRTTPDAGMKTVAEDCVYTVFVGTDGSVSVDDGTVIFVGQDTSVAISTNSPTTDQWLASEISAVAENNQEYRNELVTDAEKQYAYMYENGFLSTFYPYSYYVSASTARQDSSVLSLLMVNSTYQGGAHPNSWREAINFDLVNQRRLSLEDVILPGQEETFLDMLLWTLENRISTVSSDMFYENYRDVVTDSITGADLTDNWYFTEDGLVVYYNNYDIAPYAAGTITVELSYSRLEGVLEPDFFPEERGGELGELTLSAECDCTNEILLRLIGNDGAYLWETTIGVQGVVYDVRMYYVSRWLTDQTPVLGDMIFSASHLSEMDCVTITSDNGSTNAYLITYRTGAGEDRAVTLDQDSLEEANVLIG